MFATPPLPRPVFDTAEGADAFGDLPDWNLDDLYPGQDSDQIKADTDWLGTACADFAERYQGKLATLDAEGLLACIAAYEAIQNKAGRIMSFAGLQYYQNTTDADRGKFFADMQNTVNEFTTALVFFSLEVNRIPDDHLDALLSGNADLARYRPVLDRLRAMKPYQLSDELEQFLHDQGVVGAAGSPGAPPGTACSTKPWPR